MMKKTNSLLLTGLLGCTLMGAFSAHAEDAALPAAEPASPHSFSANVGFFSDYVFRGISYTRERGALQGGFDYSHSSGIYLGTWASNVHKDALYGNTLEVDLYGGYIHKFTDDVSLNVGFLQFFYPDSDKIAGQSANTTELNAAVTYKYLTLKHSYALTDFFGYNTKSIGGLAVGSHTLGTGDTKGTGYTELNLNYPLPYEGLNLALHVGHQAIKNYSALSYTDFLIGVNKDFAIAGSTGWNAGINYITTDATDNFYADLSGWKTGDDKTVVYLKRTF